MRKVSLAFIILGIILLTSCSLLYKNADFVDVIVVKTDKEIILPEAKNDENMTVLYDENEAFVVETFTKTPHEDFEEYLENGKLFTKLTYYRLSDGTWKTDEYSYKYKLTLTGRMNNAAKDSTFVILSNSPNITFDMAWKAYGYSSNMDDYFKPEEAVFVAVS